MENTINPEATAASPTTGPFVEIKVERSAKPYVKVRRSGGPWIKVHELVEEADLAALEAILAAKPGLACSQAASRFIAFRRSGQPLPADPYDGCIPAPAPAPNPAASGAAAALTAPTTMGPSATLPAAVEEDLPDLLARLWAVLKNVDPELAEEAAQHLQFMTSRRAEKRRRTE